MKDMTLGTFICCMVIWFLLGFIACHKLYSANGDNIHTIGGGKLILN